MKSKIQCKDNGLVIRMPKNSVHETSWLMFKTFEVANEECCMRCVVAWGVCSMSWRCVHTCACSRHSGLRPGPQLLKPANMGVVVSPAHDNTNLYWSQHGYTSMRACFSVLGALHDFPDNLPAPWGPCPTSLPKYLTKMWRKKTIAIGLWRWSIRL